MSCDPVTPAAGTLEGVMQTAAQSIDMTVDAAVRGWPSPTATRGLPPPPPPPPVAVNPAWQPDCWIQTYTGRRFWPTRPSARDIDIVDIAHALSMKCRYSGHCHTFYSVAEHSVIVSRHLPPQFALWGLLHDTSEAYLPDVARPIKPLLAGFKALEDGIMAAVCERYGLPLAEPAEVKRVDTAILADELEQVMGPPPHPWGLPEKALGVTLPLWQPHEAKDWFLDRFLELVGGASHEAQSLYSGVSG